MASEEANKSAGHEPVESLIDDLIRDIFREAGPSTKKTRARGGDSMASLIEAAITSPSTMPRASTLERLLTTQVIASTLADALAPALAEALAPEIMKALEQHTAGGRSGGEAATTPARPQPRGGRRKT